MSSYKDDLDDDNFSRAASVDSQSSRVSSTARHIELTQRTNELLSNFGNFLHELGDSTQSSSPKHEFGEETALQSPRSSGHSSSTVPADNLSPFRDSYSDHRNDDVSYEPAGGGTNLWNTSDRSYYDYDSDRKKLYRYRLLGGNNMAYVCTFGVIIALAVIAGVSIGDRNKEKTPSTATVYKEHDITNMEEEVVDLLTNLDKSYMPKDPETKEKYLAVAETFRPKWFNRESGWEGQAYLQAYEFCYSQNEMQPCPYLALCPGGVGNPPYGGVKENMGGGAWAPIKNVPNEWVRVSANTENDQEGQICQMYSTSHSITPRWGLTGTNAESQTTNILCCLVDDDVMANEPDLFTNIVHEISYGGDMGSDVISRPPNLEDDESSNSVLAEGDEDTSVSSPFNSASSTSIPAVWYSRSDGWKGSTYKSAEDFCASQNGKKICPFQIYCPDGPGSVPYAASAQQALLDYDSLFWSPVFNGFGEEAWIGIGSANRCVPPLTSPRTSPDLLYDATSFIMCCEMQSDVDNKQGSSSVAKEDTSLNAQEIVNEIVSQVEEFTESEFMTAARDVWNPKWFSVDDGWNGGSYATASEFCSNNLPTGELCPYQAICPNGVSTNPYMSSNIAASEITQWVPTRSGVFSYILVSHGSDGSNESICDSYQNINNEQPILGTTEGMQDLKQYLLCCHHYPSQV